jgi:hypothetical protein
MATQTGIVLNVNSKDYDAYSCSYHFNQGTAGDGFPNGSVIGGQIQLILNSTKDTSLVEWMCDASKNYDGKVTFYQPDDLTKTMKTLNFKKGFCVSYAESFSSGPNGTQAIVISANEVSIGNADLNNNWPA